MRERERDRNNTYYFLQIILIILLVRFYLLRTYEYQSIETGFVLLSGKYNLLKKRKKSIFIKYAHVIFQKINYILFRKFDLIVTCFRLMYYS